MSVFRPVFWISAILLCTAPVMAQAQPTPSSKPFSNHCDRAKSTVDVLECVKNHHEDTMGRLNNVYQTLIAPAPETSGDEAQMPVLSDEEKEALKTAQQSWIAYRDAECGWEKTRAAAPALERIDELACLTELTAARIERLLLLKGRATGETPREFGERPRWMNVVAAENPDVFWRYGSGLEADLDCDGTAENIMTGVLFKDPSNGEAASVSMALVIAGNPQTGRPAAHVLYVPVVPDEASAPATEPFLCRAAVDLSLDGQEAPDNEVCLAILKIDDKTCPLLQVQRTETGYGISKTESPEQ
ncbi:MAG: DUF1311 domain-containing protein [Rhodospirillales bacterium]|nr:DUF1311 domain-containing protein [Rhodospirillales bacterium]